MKKSFKTAVLAGLALSLAWFAFGSATGPVFEAAISALMAFLIWCALAWYWTRTSR
jgi:uncharacterized membrane protein